MFRVAVIVLVTSAAVSCTKSVPASSAGMPATAPVEDWDDMPPGAFLQSDGQDWAIIHSDLDGQAAATLE